jgi:hypothetical protein
MCLKDWWVGILFVWFVVRDQQIIKIIIFKIFFSKNVCLSRSVSTNQTVAPHAFKVVLVPDGRRTGGSGFCLFGLLFGINKF